MLSQLKTLSGKKRINKEGNKNKSKKRSIMKKQNINRIKEHIIILMKGKGEEIGLSTMMILTRILRKRSG